MRERKFFGVILSEVNETERLSTIRRGITRVMSGCEWVIEAHGCDPAALTDLKKMRELFARLTAELALNPVCEATWHKFPGTGGITGLCLLAESHLACHTFPEHGSLCLNVFCCRPRNDFDFARYLKREFAATTVNVRRIDRPYLAPQHESAAS